MIGSIRKATSAVNGIKMQGFFNPQCPYSQITSIVQAQITTRKRTEGKDSNKAYNVEHRTVFSIHHSLLPSPSHPLFVQTHAFYYETILQAARQ